MLNFHLICININFILSRLDAGVVLWCLVRGGEIYLDAAPAMNKSPGGGGGGGGRTLTHLFQLEKKSCGKVIIMGWTHTHFFFQPEKKKKVVAKYLGLGYNYHHCI